MYKLLKNLIPGIAIFILLFGFARSSIYAEDCTVPTDPTVDPICGAFSGPPVVDDNISAAQNTLIKFTVKFNKSFDFDSGSKIIISIGSGSPLSCSNNHIRISQLTNAEEISTYCDFNGYGGQTVDIHMYYCEGSMCVRRWTHLLDSTKYPVPYNDGDQGKRLVMNSLAPRCNATGDWVQRFAIIDTWANDPLRGISPHLNYDLILVKSGVTVADLVAKGSCLNLDRGSIISAPEGRHFVGEIECKVDLINGSGSDKYEIQLWRRETWSDKPEFLSGSINITSNVGYAKLNSANQVAGKRQVEYRYDIRESVGSNYIFDIIDNKNTFLQSCGSKTGNSCEINVGSSCTTNNLIPGHDYFLVMKRNVNPTTYPNYVEVNRVSFRYESPDPATDDTCTCVANNCNNATIPQATNKCLLGKTATIITCIPVSAANTSCTCKCQGTATPIDDAVPPVQPGAVRLPVYNLETFKGFIGWIHNLLIAVGVVAAVFIFPYTLVLMASGNPENINKGKEWLYSLLVGLGVLILSGTIIRLFGNVLSL